MRSSLSIILKSRNLWTVVVLTALFFLIAPLFPRSYVFDVSNSFSVAGVIGVIVMYYASIARKTGSWLWVFRNDLSGVHYFVIGIMGLMSYVAIRHTYNSIWRWLGKPEWMADHLFVSYLIFGTFIIAVMHLLSRDLEEGQIPKENWRWVGIWTAVGIALAGLSVTFLDPSPAVVSSR